MIKLKSVLAVSFAALMATTAVAAAEPTPPGAVDPAAIKAHAKQVAEWRRTYGEGPYPDEIDQFVTLHKEPLRPYYKALYTGGERNAVLNLSRLGLAAMELGHWTDAERAFDAALMRIEFVYSKNKAAEAARSLWHKEANKDWKGEPYERAMAYYYRGLLYLRKGDYNNAHAAFKGAEFQDTVSESDSFQSDFALMNYLVGWSAQCAGDSGATDYDEAIKSQTGLTVPSASDNVMLIAELGHGPVKAKDGKMREKLVFHPAEGFPETGAIFTLSPVRGAKTTYGGHVASSVYYQATTRGGRAMDGILNGKAEWKSTTAKVGSGTMQVGLQMMQNDVSGAGAYVALAGAMFSMFSSAMKTDADIRQWDSLPDGISLATGHAVGEFKPSVVFTTAQGSIDLPPTPVMQASVGKCAIVWVRSRSALMDAATPGDDPKVRDAVAHKKNVQAKDKTFRTALAADFRD